MTTRGALYATNTAPARMLREVTPDSDNDLPDGVCRALYVGGAGTLNVIAAEDTDAVSLGAVAAGYHPISVRRVLASGTNATGIIALY